MKLRRSMPCRQPQDCEPTEVRQDASPAQEEAIHEALASARDLVAAGLATLSKGPPAEGDAGPFQDHLHTTEPGMLSRAEAALGATRAGLASNVPIEVEGWMPPWEGSTNGYIWGGIFASSSDIHLTPRFFTTSAEEQARTITHEATHKYAGTEDHAYNGSSRYWNLDPELAVDNADSLAWFCTVTARGRE